MGKINILSKHQLGDFEIALDPITKIPEIISSKMGQLKLAFGFTKCDVDRNDCEEALNELSQENLSITHVDILESIKNNQPEVQLKTTSDEGGLLVWRKIDN